MIWSTERDRTRIARIQAKREQYLRLASNQTSDLDRRRHLQMVRRLDRQAQIARTYPLSIMLFSVVVITPLLLWAILKRHGHPKAGLIIALAAALAEAAFLTQRRRRRTT